MYRHVIDEVFDELSDEDAGIKGHDTRYRVFDTRKWPYCTVCKLKITYPTKLSEGSGVLIGDKYVLTAGHNAYERRFGGYATDIEVIPGLNGNDEPFGRARVVNWLLFTAWTQHLNRDGDMAVLSLSTNIGDSTGWLGYGDCGVAGAWAYLSGYPGNLNGGTGQYWDSGRITLSPENQNRVWYQMDADKGQSGSGLWRIIDGKHYVFAVHVGDTGGFNNFGTLITPWKLEAINDFIGRGG